MREKNSLLPALSRLLLVLILWVSPQARADAWLIDINGAIGPAVADHMIRGLVQARESGAELVILRIDTPGGLDLSMRSMIKEILAAELPVIAWVGPEGARAASAGTYILYATHIASMAPATNLGAATPVQIGAPGLGMGEEGESEDSPSIDKPVPASGAAMERKIVNDAVAYIQGLAQLRGRNAEWAEQAVRMGASLSAGDALDQGVIELLVDSEQALLVAVHGRTIQLNGQSHVIDTDQLQLYEHPLDWRSEFLGVITDPNIAYILMLIGIYGLILEFYNPGVGLPGVVGAVSLLLALYAMQVLPVSYAGLGLILLGIALMTAEAFAPSFGVLGLGGVVAFVVGSVMLMDTEIPVYQIAWPTIAALSVFSAFVSVAAIGLMLKARRQTVVSGREHLLAATAQVESMSEGQPMVRLDGELWEARAASALQPGDQVKILTVDGVTLEVEKISGGSSDV